MPNPPTQSPGNAPIPPIVFISYAHEGDLTQRVGELAEWLTSKGVQVITDHPYVNHPPIKGWRAWMQHSIEDADTVLIVCSERYKRLFERRDVPDSEGGGVTWESAIINSELYSALLHNHRFYPILPDDGEHSHVPAILTDWHNNHRFPSGNQRIFSLIAEAVHLPTPSTPFQLRLNGELSGPDDGRLQPREGKLIGRSGPVADVLEFLNGTSSSAAICGHITGSAGIGKTEVCKAALKQWLAQPHTDARAFWVRVNDDADAMRLIAQLGEAVGLEPDTVAQLSSVAQLRPYLPNGLYCLDNLESVAESPQGVALLRDLSQLPNVRLLASSRVSLDGVLGTRVLLSPLSTDDAVALFLRCWRGRTEPERTEIAEFVDQQLGGHPLSITLLARLGRAYSWASLQTLWHQHGTAAAKERKANSRIDSLNRSFALTAKVLANEPGALDLWQFMALFPDGLNEGLLSQWEEISGHTEARVAMADHHLLTLTDGYLSMLPPLARYALDNAIDNTRTAQVTNPAKPSHFDWNRARQHAYGFFITLSHGASNTISSDDNTQTRRLSQQYLWAIHKLFKTDRATGTPKLNAVKQLHRQLHNVYAFNAPAGQASLRQVNRMLGDGLSEQRLGDLETRLGNLTIARQHYDRAIELYHNQQTQLGLANAYQSLGDLWLSDGKPEEAKIFYQDAVDLYRAEQSVMGLASTLAELMRCHHQQGGGADATLKALAVEALNSAEKSHTEPVTRYVLQALGECFDQDEGKLNAFIASLSAG